ncbi:MAG: exonuclease SbcCD subunit D [Candidatus Bathyarchaeia archaeon]
MKFAVLADAHIGRSIPLSVAEHRRRAFNRAFTRAVDEIVEEGVDYVFICGDLFERRTLRPYLVQFAHDELYRLAVETYKRHGNKVKILLIRGNHDGRPHSDTLDYLKHPLAEYLHVFEDDELVYKDERIYVVGLNYYERLDTAYNRLAVPALEEEDGLKILMLHGFVSGYNPVPPYSSYVTLDQLTQGDPDFVFTGHYHKRCKPKRLTNGGWVVTPGSLEIYDFAEEPEKGFYIIDTGSESDFRWIPIEPLHIMRQINIQGNRKRSPSWYEDRIRDEVIAFQGDLKEADKHGYLRVRVRGRLGEGFPSDIDLNFIDELVEEDPLLLWVDVDTMDLELPPMAVRPRQNQVDISEFFKDFDDFTDEIREMHETVKETLEEQASHTTGLLTPSDRAPLIELWVERFENRSFKREDE